MKMKVILGGKIDHVFSCPVGPVRIRHEHPFNLELELEIPESPADDSVIVHKSGQDRVVVDMPEHAYDALVKFIRGEVAKASPAIQKAYEDLKELGFIS